MDGNNALIRIAIIGNDKRQMVMAEELKQVNAAWSVMTLDSQGNPENMGDQAEYIVLPVAGVEKIGYVDETWIKSLDKNTVILAGRTGAEFAGWCAEQDISVKEYLNRIDFQIANAVPTAEGAVKLYLEKSEKTVDHARMLVMGLGRCGTALALRLKAWGAEVTVFARKNQDVILGNSMGLDVKGYDRLPEFLSEADCIFNTVPASLLDTSNLCLVSKACMIIDLASAPGGTDFTECQRLGIDGTLALGLPGIYFPKTAGKILADTIVCMIHENSLAAKSNIGGW